jgi:hypothetical protein
LLPPASEKNVAFCPLGETSSMSIESGQVELRLSNSTSTSVIEPDSPDTTHVDG